MDGGPLCVAGAFDWKAREVVPGLYLVYVKKIGMRIGPFYASIPLAEKGMKKGLKMKSGVWDQPIEWISRQDWLRTWIEKEMGKFTDIVGAEWARD